MDRVARPGIRADVIGEVDPNPALQNNQCTTVLIEGCQLKAKPRPDAGELIEVCTLTADEVRAVDKDILAPFGRLNEAEPFLVVPPLARP